MPPKPRASTSPVLPVALALHDPKSRYWAYTATAIHSLCLHSSVPLGIHLLHDETVQLSTLEALQKICAAQGHGFTSHQVRLPAKMDSWNFEQFSPASVYRLMIPQLLSEHPLVLYLDSDIIFNGLDVAELLQYVQQDSDEHPLAAAHDPLFTCQSAQVRELAQIGISAEEYFQSGVLLMRPPKIRMNLMEALEAFAARHPGITHLDQDLLNVLFKEQVFRLPPKFNCQVNISYGQCFQELSFYEGKILHYSGKTKPLGGTLCPPDIFFWRYSLPLGDRLSGLLPQPLRYLQKMREHPHGARLIRVVEPQSDTAQSSHPQV